MKHIYYTYLLTILMSMAGAKVSAHDIEVANSDGKTIYYTYNTDGTSVSVTYQGTSDTSYSNEYTGDVVIPETVTYGGKTYSVTSIGSGAFYHCIGLTSVTIPNSVTNIGSSAFYGCSGLTSMTIGSSVTSIGSSAFSGTTWYNNQPDGLVYAGNVAYKYKGTMPANTSITLREGTVGIASSAFSGCSGLTSMTIPNSVTSIGEMAFSGCSGLPSVTIPNSVTSIGEYAFSGTAWYDNQPEGVVYAGNVAYKYKGTMPANTSITLKEGTVGIASYAFSYCSGLTSVTIPNSVTSIGSSAFEYCSGLKKVIVPNFDIKNWCSIKFGDYYSNPLQYAHHLYSDENTEITKLVIPDGVTSIPNYVFSGCSSLTSITIPNSVTSIGSSAFSSCSGLTSVTIPNSVTSIGSYAFYGCDGLTSVTIPNSVTSIGSYAFDGCSGLTSVTIPNSVTSIGEMAFIGCSSLTSVTIPNSVTNIGKMAFSGCSGLTSVTIPNSVTSIGISAFSGCSGLTEIKVADGNNVYDSRNNCNAIIETSTNTIIAWFENTIIPNSVTSIGSYAFSSYTSLTSITIPNSITSIGSHAFFGCSGLTSVTIPNSVTSIDSKAFQGCSSLTSVTIPNSVTSIGTSAFQGCSSLTSVTIPNSVTSISSSAFYNCSGLTSVTIPNSVTSIGSQAFQGCSGLKSVTIGNSVTSIGGNAFSGCSGLTSVTWNAKNYPAFSSYSSSPFYNIRTQITKFIIGNKVTNTPSYLCYDMKNLKFLISRSVLPIQSVSNDGLKTSTKIVVPEESLDDYKKAWLEYYRPDVYTYLPIPSDGVMFTEKATPDNYAAAMQDIDKSTITSVCFYDSIDANLTVEKIQEGMNPNCLYYYYSDNALQGKNLVNLANYNAENVTLSDGGLFRCIMPFQAKKASFTFAPQIWADGKGGWTALCLPFEVSAFKASEEGYISPILLGAYGDFWLRQFVGASSKALYFSSTLDGTMKANTPYLLAFPGSVMGNGHLQGQTITFLGKNVEFEANATAEVQRNDKVFVGNYDNVADDASGWILNSTGSDLIASSVVGDKPFRAYFRTEDDFADFNAAKTLNISFVEDEETAIKEINEDQDAENDLNIYSIDGTLVRKAGNTSDSLKGLKKGTYIINHKKVMIR